MESNIFKIQPGRNTIVIFIIILAYCAGTALTMFQGEPQVDEKDYHLPLVKKFEAEFPAFDFINDYSIEVHALNNNY